MKASSICVHTKRWHNNQRSPITATCSQQQLLTAGFSTSSLGHCLSRLHRRGSNAVKYGSAISRRRLFSSGASGEKVGEVTFVENEDAKQRKNDPDMVALVTGANRGIGLEVTRQLLERTAGESESIDDTVHTHCLVFVEERQPRHPVVSHHRLYRRTRTC